MSDPVSRRSFVAASAVAAAPALLSAQGANNRLKVGWIATGSRGYHCLEQMYKGSAQYVEVTAICDTYTGNLNRGKDRVQTMGGNTPKTYVDYKDLLADPNVDVVFIMTPEHLHHSMVMAALKAKKHIYVEKPLSHTLEEGAEILKAVEKAGVVLQVGTQNRSNKLYLKAKEMFEQGMIGQVHYVRAFWYRNFLPTDRVPAAWRYVIPEDADEQNADWNRFLGPAAKRPFDKRRYFQWRNYWDYSQGIATDLLVHQTDIANFVLGKTVPTSCVASGGIYVWGKPDDREVPDTLSALYEYPGNLHVNYSCFFGNDHFGYGEQFLGTEGMLEVLDRQNLRFYPQTFRGRAPKHILDRKEIHLNNIKDFNQPDSTKEHIENFVQAVLGKEKAIAPARVGQDAAIPGHLATISYLKNKKVFWDAKTEKLTLS